MIKALILDMDGVILESTDIKTEAFRQLFSKWPDKVDEMITYHRRNMGVSRYVKIRHFYETILKEPYCEEIGERMAREFSAIVLQNVKNAPLVPGVQELLKNNTGIYQMFVASGTPHDELLEIIRERGMEAFFTGIYGSPETKVMILEKILTKWNFMRKEVVFVGDAEADLEAARMTGVQFILRKTSENGYLLKNTVYSITDFRSISDLIVSIGTDD